MKKILTASQTREADAFTIKNEPITSIDLMERASQVFVDEFQKLRIDAGNVQVVCGVGNNGGDGLAISRLLMDKGINVEVILLKFSNNLSEDCQINLDRITDKVSVIKPSQYETGDTHLIIDAIFGSGLNRPVEGDLCEVIEKINTSFAQVVSVDIPSGLFTDESGSEGAIIRADHTITFQCPKLSFLLPESGMYAGQFHVVDIGLNKTFIESAETGLFYQSDNVYRYLHQRGKFQHKGDFGRVYVIAGSLGKVGAAYLCASAVLRSGAGLLTVHVPKCGMTPLQSSLPEAMLSLDTHEEIITSIPFDPQTDVYCLGPGIGINNQTVKGFRDFLEKRPKRLVIDADGLNIISRNKELFDLLPEQTVITPHVGEFHRLFGKCNDGKERIRVAQNIAEKRNLIIVLKGAHTSIVLPNRKVVFNCTGNPGMATAGSGDVLVGIIAGFIAQGLSSANAAELGVYIHGKAGDLARDYLGEWSLMASDLLVHLPKAIRND